MGNLKEFFEENPKLALGFSGRVDSSYLLYAGKKFGADIQAYFVKTPFQPDFEWEDAKRLAKGVGLELKTIPLDVLTKDEIVENPSNRCYYCKQAIFTSLKNQAKKDGYHVLIDGTNASDEVSDRPGMKALAELEVRSPLREAGLSKEEIRALSREAGLFTWDKASYSCLATRIPTGESISEEKLAKVQAAEDALFDLGFTDFRVRYFHGAARIQILKAEWEKAAKKRGEILQAIKPFFDTVLFDLELRDSSWNQ